MRPMPFIPILQRLFCLLLPVLCLGGPAGAQEPAGVAEETMLMFVGEEKPVTTVASRTPESPTTAPAMVTVIGRDEIRRGGYRTLAELLQWQGGFFMAPGGRGTIPYLRGQRDGILFLYDGVPMTTDVTKSFAPLDREISLDGVERVEIVRGPGSVLWGPDAFAGVVNIVPLGGGRQPGLEAGIAAGTERLLTGNLRYGVNRGRWDASVFASAASERYHLADYTGYDGSGRSDNEDLKSSRYGEGMATFNYGDWFRLTGRWSDFTRRYTMGSIDDDIRWEGNKQAPVNLLKATLSKVAGPSHFTLTGFYQETDYQVRDADFERRQRNRVGHIELLYDRRFLKYGLFTAGASWRRNDVDGAVVRDGFLPDFLSPKEPLFISELEQASFDNSLTSIFSQVRYQWGKSQWWAGLRYDDHSQYDSTLSYSVGFYRPLGADFHLKTTFGNAFRSPYSSQLFANQSFEPEAIRTLSAQLAWDPGRGRRAELTLFHSHLENHRVEDAYGGLSATASRDSYGLELTAQAEVAPFLRLFGGLSLLGGNDGGEDFRVLRYSFARPDGTEVRIYDEWSEPIDRGPRWMANVGVEGRLGPGHTLRVGARAGGGVPYSFEKGTVEGKYHQPLLIDLTYCRPGFFKDRDSFTLHITNLLDQDYDVPDLYGPTEGPPLEAMVIWRWHFR